MSQTLDQTLAVGVSHHNAGRLAEAEAIYRGVLAAHPNNDTALDLLGQLAGRVNRHDAACDLFRQAIRLNPANPGYPLHLARSLAATNQWLPAAAAYEQALRLGSLDPSLRGQWAGALFHAGQLPQAIELFRQLAAETPNNASAWSNLAVALLQARRASAALDAARRAVEVNPNHADAWNVLGNILKELRQFDAAIDALRRATVLNPQYAEAFSNLGTALIDAERFPEAAEACRQAVVLRPDMGEAFNNFANALRGLGRFDEAIRCYQRALELLPNTPQILSNMANVLQTQERYDAAIEVYQQAMMLQPNHAEGYYNLANCLRLQNRREEAIVAYRKAIELRPTFAEACNNLGNELNANGQAEEAVEFFERALIHNPALYMAAFNKGNGLQTLGRFAEAEAEYRRSIEMNPNFPTPRWNLALLLLLHGRFEEGFTEYEHRWDVDEFKLQPRRFSAPRWRGEQLDGKSIFVHAEQGFGDSIQFVRYMPMIAERGGKVILFIQEELVRLLGDFPGVTQYVSPPAPLPKFDVHIPLLSLPHQFGTTLDTIPSPHGYLHASADDVQRWAERLSRYEAQDGPVRRMRVGLSWAGRPTHKNDRLRSISLSALSPLAGIENIRFFSIQQGDAAQQAQTPPPGMELVDLGSELKDFADTAALVQNLDLLITVDTAPAHLAGALGKPVWTLIQADPDWRWMLQRTDSPWYSTMRLFRQPQRHDWQTPIAEVAAALRELAANFHPTA